MGLRNHYAIKSPSSKILFDFIAYGLISITAVVCLIPFCLIISGSLTDNTSIIRDGYHLIPKILSTSAFKTILKFPEGILTAYRVTAFNTMVGTGLGLFLISMAGYVLQRKDFKYRNVFSFLIYFTSIFGGGLIPWYILLTKYLNLRDSYVVLIYPGLMTPFLIILMKSFISISVPIEIVESAKIDGAGDFRIYRQIVLPLAIPGIATIGLFLSLNYWNDWFLSSTFISSPEKYTIQFYLYNMLNSYEFMKKMSQTGESLAYQIPSESVKMAMAVIATGPVILFYPFVQRYIIKGLTVGAVKG